MHADTPQEQQREHRRGDRLHEVMEAGYDTKAAPIYAHALVGMVTFVGRWWTETRKPSIEEAASYLSALAWMGLRHLPKKPASKRR